MTDDDVLAGAKRRLLELELKGWGDRGLLALSEEEQAVEAELALLLAPRAMPAPEQRAADQKRLEALHCKALTPGLFLSEADKAEILEILPLGML